MDAIFSLLLGSCFLAISPIGVSDARNSSVPVAMKLLVKLFNLLVDTCISFQYDFGSGVYLLNGNATVRIFSSIQVLSYSEMSRIRKIGTLAIRSPLGFQIISDNNLKELNLFDCYMELNYSVVSSTNATITKPTSVWLDSCEKIVIYRNYTKPSHAAQVLPLLSQAIFTEASKYFSFSDYPLRVELKTLRKLFGLIIHSGHEDGTQRRDCRT